MKIAIIGGGIAGKEIIESFTGIPQVEVVGLVDLKEDAPGVILAKSLKIPTYKDMERLKTLSSLDMIIEVTGHESIYRQVLASYEGHCSIMDSQSALLLMQLAKSNSQKVTQLDLQVKAIDKASNSASTALEDFSTSFDRIKATTKEMDDFAKQTALAIENIHKMMAYVDGIAKQTKILGINASIEAARAGEQGKAFAIVAKEIQTMAITTEERSQKIAQVLEGLSVRMDDLNVITTDLQGNASNQGGALNLLTKEMKALKNICQKDD